MMYSLETAEDSEAVAGGGCAGVLTAAPAWDFELDSRCNRPGSAKAIGRMSRQPFPSPRRHAPVLHRTVPRSLREQQEQHLFPFGVKPSAAKLENCRYRRIMADRRPPRLR